MRDRVYGFTGPYRYLSNFFPAPLVWEGIKFPTSEHAFNAGKTLDQHKRLWIAAAPSPGEAKSRGRSVQLRPGWDETVRYQVMEEVLAAKFADEHLAGWLLATGELELVEANQHHDIHWGVCTCRRHDGVGDNHLGRLLMELRTRLAG